MDHGLFMKYFGIFFKVIFAEFCKGIVLCLKIN